MRYEAWFDSDENRALMAICTRKLIKNIGITVPAGGVLENLAVDYTPGTPLTVTANGMTKQFTVSP